MEEKKEKTPWKNTESVNQRRIHKLLRKEYRIPPTRTHSVKPKKRKKRKVYRKPLVPWGEA